MPRQSRNQRKPQLRIVERGAEPEVAFGGREQTLLEPQLMLRHRGARMCDCALELRLLGLRECSDFRNHQLLNELQHTRILLDCRFRVNSRHARGIEDLANLCEQSRQLVQARSDAVQALRQWREIASHQQVDAVAGEIRVEQRIPTPLLQLLAVPDLILQLIDEELGVDLMSARQTWLVHLPQLSQQLACKRGAALVSCRADIIEHLVVAVVALRCRLDGRQGQHVV